ncbi:MAG: fumarylacetoacetase [Planctomycetes bacterium]|nr:fumarylacetoacetase [Planctomycetota bacterium]
MTFIDETHVPTRRSWVESAQGDGTDFPIQNLPYGVFRRGGSGEPRIGVAIGDAILDVRGAAEAGLIDGLGGALTGSTLNAFLAAGDGAWRTTRRAVATLLDAGTATLRDDATGRGRLLVAQADAEMLVPTAIGDYTDFYCSIHHATNVGSMFRPDNPLMPNYKHLPVGYHGRASSIVASGQPVRRPQGQTIAADADAPTFGPSRLLDYEMEMGFFTGPGNATGERIAMREASRHIFGMCIVNDWSARDVQKWEYQPLGPFNAKNFLTTISPWIVTLHALAPYRVAGPPRAADDPPLLEYLQPADDMGVDIVVEVLIASEAMRAAGQAPVRVSRGNFRDLYWTIAQMLAHHTSTGCPMRPGDLLASGTVSGPTEDARGCLLERTWRGQQPIDLPDGTQRKFLQDGDEVIMRAWCERSGAVRIGFGSCRGVVQPAG